MEVKYLHIIFYVQEKDGKFNFDKAAIKNPLSGDEVSITILILSSGLFYLICRMLNMLFTFAHKIFYLSISNNYMPM